MAMSEIVAELRLVLDEISKEGGREDNCFW
jgi:hypothetical protein